MNENPQPGWDDEDEDDLPRSRTGRVLKMLALDLVIGQPVDWRHLLAVALLPVMLIALVIWAAPKVVKQQQGMQAADASFSYPELLAARDSLMPLPALGAEEGVSRQLEAAFAGCRLAQFPLRVAADDRAWLQGLLPGVESGAAAGAYAEPAMSLANGFFQRPGERAFFELGLWLEKSRQAVDVALKAGDTAALERSFREKPRVLAAMLALPQQGEWREAVRTLQAASLPADAAGLVEYRRQLLELANSLRACAVVS